MLGLLFFVACAVLLWACQRDWPKVNWYMYACACICALIGGALVLP